MGKPIRVRTDDKMCGNIIVAICLSVFPVLGCRWATLGSKSSRRRETGTSPRLEPVSLPSDLVELPFEVPRFLLEPRGWPTTTSLGMEVVSPSTQHIPTTVTLSPLTRGPSIAEDAGRLGSSSRSLAVWPWVSGRMASGLSPYGVASFVHARLGSGITRSQ